MNLSAGASFFSFDSTVEPIPNGADRTVLESTDTVSFHEKVPPSPAGGLFAFAFDTPIKTFAFFSEERP